MSSSDLDLHDDVSGMYLVLLSKQIFCLLK